ncbi:MAG: hypothetical protein ACOCRZ_02450 [Halothermotrichaceae bacterium]
MEVSINSWLTTGWKTYKNNFGILIGLILLLFLLSIGAFIIPGLLLNHAVQIDQLNLPDLKTQLAPETTYLLSIYFIILFIAGFFLAPIIDTGFSYLLLKLVRGKKGKITDVFKPFSFFWPAWLTIFLTQLIILGGFLLFYIPGFVFIFKYYFSKFAVVDKKYSAEDSISYSAKITYGHKLKLFVLTLIPFMINFILQVLMQFISFFTVIIPKSSTIIVLLIIIFFAISIFVISPWMLLTIAAAYNNLSRTYEEKILNWNKDNGSKINNFKVKIESKSDEKEKNYGKHKHFKIDIINETADKKLNIDDNQNINEEKGDNND